MERAYLVSLAHQGGPSTSSKLWSFGKSTMALPEFFPLPGVEEEPNYRTLFQHSPYGTAVVQDERLVVANPMLEPNLNQAFSLTALSCFLRLATRSDS